MSELDSIWLTENSFSGEKMSSTVMDAAHIGRPAQGVASNDLDFYLPE